MVSTSTWILSLKVLLISAGLLSLALGLKVSVPLILNFSVSKAPVLWSVAVSWLRPPYLYVIINGIIITIAASSRFHHEDEEKQVEPIPVPKISVDLNPAFEDEVKSCRSDFGAMEFSRRDVIEFGDFVEEKNVVVEDCNGNGGDEFLISKSAWNPPIRMESSEIPVENLLTVDKPLVSSRIGHRKPVNRANPEGGRALRVAKPKRHETMENTWKMITERKAMPLTRHIKKSETFTDKWENQLAEDRLAEPAPAVEKSETFKDRANFQASPAKLSPSPRLKLRKEPSLSQDELNRQVEAFIKNFNTEMRLQRMESLNQYKEMINRGTGP